MEKIHAVVAIAAGLLAVLSAQQSFAQYVDPGTTATTGISEETLQKCKELGIDRIQCSESSVLLKERLLLVGEGGSGTGFLARESGQMVALIGVLGAIFGGVAAAFFLK